MAISAFETTSIKSQKNRILPSPLTRGFLRSKDYSLFLQCTIFSNRLHVLKFEGTLFQVPLSIKQLQNLKTVNYWNLFGSCRLYVWREIKVETSEKEKVHKCIYNLIDKIDHRNLNFIAELTKYCGK